jgi:hypothetical protein
MDEKPDVTDADVNATLAEIERARQSLASAVALLREREMLNPLGAMVQRHPVQSALGAATAGFMLAQASSGKRKGLPALVGRMVQSGFSSALPLLVRMLF